MDGPGRIQSEDELPVDPTEKPRMALNLIAEAWPEGRLEPENIDLSLATKICLEIEADVGEYISTLESETALSHREAQVCGLTKLINEQDEPLSNKAIGLYLLLTDDANDYISQQAIQSYSERIDDKVSDAKQTLLWISHPNHEAIFDDPAHLWMDGSTIGRLLERARNRNVRPDRLVDNLLDDSERQLPLRELVEFYRDEFSAAQVAVEKQSVETGHLAFIVHTGNPPGDIPDKVKNADVVGLDGEVFQFHVDHSAMGPQDAFRVTLFASDNIHGMDPVSVDEGINNLREALLRKQD